MDLKLELTGMREEEIKALADPKNELLLEMVVGSKEMEPIKNELNKQIGEVQKLVGNYYIKQFNIYDSIKSGIEVRIRIDCRSV